MSVKSTLRELCLLEDVAYRRIEETFHGKKLQRIIDDVLSGFNTLPFFLHDSILVYRPHKYQPVGIKTDSVSTNKCQNQNET